MARHLPLLADHSVSEAHAERLQVAEKFMTKVLSEGKVSCHTGCSNCCHYPLSISILEGITIYQWLVEHHLWTPALRSKFEEVKAKTWNLAPEIWLLSLIPCPLLDNKNRCIGYEARPFLCRTVFSYGDPYYCHPHRLGSNLTGILQRSSEVEAFERTERKILKRHQLKAVTIPFAAAVLLGESISKDEISIEDTNASLAREFQRLQ